jgi:MOSC domain-containing protein YiiM
LEETVHVHRSSEQLSQGLDTIRSAPADAGVVRLIVRRPAVDEREVVQEAVLDVDEGLLGDTWRARGSGSTADGAADPHAQVTVVNARAAETIAGEIEHWPLAGDQLYVDLDISEQNLPPGTRLSLGEAEIEMSAKPHTGCAKYAARFGVDALRFVGSPEGRALRLRGANARVLRGGAVRVGDPVVKLRTEG